MKLLITGDALWTDSKFIENEFYSFYKLYPTWERFIILNCGRIKGADTNARGIARRYDLESMTFRTNYEKYGKVADKIRNTQVIEDGKPSLIWIFHSKIETSKSFQDLIQKAKKRKITIKIFSGVTDED